MDDGVPLYPQTHPHTKVQVMPTEIQMMQNRPATAPAPLPMNQQFVLLGPENTITTCPFCNASIKTAVRYSSTSRTHIAAALWCIACCCCCIPYSAETAKNADHYCPNCQRYIGTYHR